MEVPEECEQAAVEFARQASGSPVSLSRSSSHESTASSPSSSAFSNSASTASDCLSTGTGTSVTSQSNSDDNEIPPAPAPGTKRYLLLCANSGFNRIALKNVDLTNVGHDEVLFHKLRDAYRELRGRRNWFRIPKTIEYIKVSHSDREDSDNTMNPANHYTV